MIPLSVAQRHFRDRIAEEGVEFWGEADPGQEFESPGVIRRMFGFVSPSSTV